MQLKKILFPTDFSASGEQALALATALARDSGALLLIVHIEENAIPFGSGRMYVPSDPTPAEAAEMLARVLPKDENVKFEHHLLTGDPAHEIVSFADREQVDFVVLGTHGRTGLRHALMGSVAEKVVRLANCPVATVKHLANDSRHSNENAS